MKVRPSKVENKNPQIYTDKEKEGGKEGREGGREGEREEKVKKRRRKGKEWINFPCRRIPSSSMFIRCPQGYGTPHSSVWATNSDFLPKTTIWEAKNNFKAEKPDKNHLRQMTQVHINNK